MPFSTSDSFLFRDLPQEGGGYELGEDDFSLVDFEKRLMQCSPQMPRAELMEICEDMPSYTLADKLSPSPLSDELLLTLQSYGVQAASGERNSPFFWNILPAAALIAILGIITALWWTGKTPLLKHADTMAHNERFTFGKLDGSQALRTGYAMPVQKVINTSPQGVIVPSDSSPSYCVRVDSVEKHAFFDEQGRLIEAERPQVNYIVVPLQVY